MDFKEYIQLAQRTSATRNAQPGAKLMHGTIGIATESGEILDIAKKYQFYNKPVDIVNLKEELGDLLWYLAELISAYDLDINEIMDINIKKLAVRYPETYNDFDAENRNLEKERSVLEGNKPHEVTWTIEKWADGKYYIFDDESNFMGGGNILSVVQQYLIDKAENENLKLYIKYVDCNPKKVLWKVKKGKDGLYSAYDENNDIIYEESNLHKLEQVLTEKANLLNLEVDVEYNV